MISANDCQEVFIILFGPVVAWTLVFMLKVLQYPNGFVLSAKRVKLLEMLL